MEMNLTQKLNGSKHVQLLVHIKQEKNLQKLFSELDTYSWSDELNLSIEYFTDKSSTEDIMKIVVPLLEKNEWFIGIGEDDTLLKTILQAYRYLENPLILHNISNTLDIVKELYPESNPSNDCKIPNLIRSDFSGIQWQYVSQKLYYQLENSGSRIKRLGELKSDIFSTEALLRDANLINFDSDVMKKSEFPAKIGSSQSGLCSEEACQLMRYAGFSDKSNALCISGYSHKDESMSIGTNVLAQLFYYAIDGYLNRAGDYPVEREHLIKYIIEEDQIMNDLIFLKSNKTSRWWIDSKELNIKSKYQNHVLYPCSYDDYLSAVAGDPTENLIKARQWFDHLSSLE
jgi:formiminoglutamase